MANHHHDLFVFDNVLCSHRCHAVHDIELAVEFVAHNLHPSSQNDKQNCAQFLTMLRDRVELTEVRAQPA